MAGITVDDSCVTAFNDLKARKARYITMKIVADTSVKVASVGARDKTWADFVGELTKDDPCYAVFDFDYDFEGVPRNKLLLVSWIPDTAKIRIKTIYAATKDAVIQKCGAGTTHYSASDYGQVAHETVLAEMVKKTRS